MTLSTPLPIVEVLPALRDALNRHGAAVLEAPPGAGKSTVVPLALLDEPWVRGRKILMLEPRRLAARAVATRMASSLGQRVGETVGYRMRLDTRVSRATRLEVVTEGVLTRMLQQDASLDGVAAVVFDEFHERSLQADTGLAFCLDAKQTLELDLRLLVMSATLDGAAVTKILDSAPLIRSEGRVFPVEIKYLGKGFPVLPGDTESPERLVALAVLRALRETEGDVLVFLPGAGEIRRVEKILIDSDECRTRGVGVFLLYGELPAEEQDRALADLGETTRRVILATNIAETSLTLPRIRTVVDSGLVRRAVFDPVTGMSRLETRRISRASADQRAGRAGRVSAGHCYRLWSEGSHRSLAAYTPAEIIEADLAPLALDLSRWGARNANGLRWLDAPPGPILDAGRDLLVRLGAIDESGKITAHGLDLNDWPLHPRLAHLMLESAARGTPRLGAQLAALLTERDLVRIDGRDADVLTRLDVLEGRSSAALDVDRGALARARRSIELFERRLSERSSSRIASESKPSLDAAGLLACAYPDRIGMRRHGAAGRYLLANGRGAAFQSVDRLSRSDFLVALDLDDRDREARIQLAAALDRDSFTLAHGDRFSRESQVRWSATDEAVVAREVLRFDALIIEEKSLQNLAVEEAIGAMLDGIRDMGLGCLPWDDDTRTFCARVELARTRGLRGTEAWPAFDQGTLLSSLNDWLAPWLTGITRRTHLAKLLLAEALHFRLGSAMCRTLDELLPTHIVVPTGSRVRIDYQDDLAPCASMRMQEVFGLASTPRIGAGVLPVTFKLLSPAQRPLQVTADLASFWRNAYADVRKDMRGRYPRHFWPEDPLQAEPTRRVKPR